MRRFGKASGRWHSWPTPVSRPSGVRESGDDWAMNDYWRKIFGWSWSRQRKWDPCKLQSYYSYVGKWEGFKGEAKREKLQWLNRKSAWYMIQGELIHEAIKSQINQWAIGRPVSKDAAKSLFSFRLSQVQQSPRDFLLDEVKGFHIPDESYDEWRQ